MDAAHFRQVLGQYPTGVAVVAALDDSGNPLGMTVGSFTSVSIDPPLVAFLPDKNSSSWRALEATGQRFCVNLLSAAQEDVCRAMTKKEDKFAGITRRPSPAGHPIIDGALAYIDCDLETTYEAGDHVIVIGRVTEMAIDSGELPLLFYRGGYGSFKPLSLATGDADVMDQLRRVDSARHFMESLAADLAAEVVAVVLSQDQLVTAAVVGRHSGEEIPTQVGQRFPFMAPLGSVFAAWGGDQLRKRWIANYDENCSAVAVSALNAMLDTIKHRGYALLRGDHPTSPLEALELRMHGGDGSVTETRLRDEVKRMVQKWEAYHLPSTEAEQDIELYALTMPVFDQNGQVAFGLTLRSPEIKVDYATFVEYVDALTAAARGASQALSHS